MRPVRFDSSRLILHGAEHRAGDRINRHRAEGDQQDRRNHDTPSSSVDVQIDTRAQCNSRPSTRQYAVLARQHMPAKAARAVPLPQSRPAIERLSRRLLRHVVRFFMRGVNSKSLRIRYPAVLSGLSAEDNSASPGREIGRLSERVARR